MLLRGSRPEGPPVSSVPFVSSVPSYCLCSSSSSNSDSSSDGSSSGGSSGGSSSGGSSSGSSRLPLKKPVFMHLHAKAPHEYTGNTTYTPKQNQKQQQHQQQQQHERPQQVLLLHRQRPPPGGPGGPPTCQDSAPQLNRVGYLICLFAFQTSSEKLTLASSCCCCCCCSGSAAATAAAATVALFVLLLSSRVFFESPIPLCLFPFRLQSQNAKQQQQQRRQQQQQQQQQQQHQEVTRGQLPYSSMDRSPHRYAGASWGGLPPPRRRSAPYLSPGNGGHPRGAPRGPPRGPRLADESPEADASESPHLRLPDPVASVPRVSGAPSRRKGPPLRRGPSPGRSTEGGGGRRERRLSSSDFQSLEVSDEPPEGRRPSEYEDPGETVAAAAAAAEAAGAARAAARAAAAAAAASAAPLAGTVRPEAVTREAAAARALAAKAAANPAEVDLFKVAVKIHRDTRLSPQQKAVASQRVVAAALEQEQQRFRGRSRKGRLLWAASRLFRGDSHFFFAFPIFSLLFVCLCVEVTLYAFVLLLLLLLETLFFRLHSAATRLCRNNRQQQQQEEEQQQEQDESPISSVVASSVGPCSPIAEKRGAPWASPPGSPDRRRGEGPSTPAAAAAAAAGGEKRGLLSFVGGPLRRVWKGMRVRGSPRGPSLRGLQLQLETCQSYSSFAAAARELDAATGRTAWKQRDRSRLYDASATRQQLEALRTARRHHDPTRLAQEALRALQGPAQAALKESLYSRTYMDTKDLIEALLLELGASLKALSVMLQADPSLLPSLQQNVRDIAAQWRPTALVLSAGGAMLGLHHFGLIEGLLFNNETGENLLPKVIAGCSAGAAMAAWLCTRTDEELLRECREEYIANTFRGLAPNNWGARLLNLCQRGYMCDTSAWVSASQKLFRDITFKEAFERTGRVPACTLLLFLSLSVSQLMNYKNAPNVVVWSAVCCSCAFPFLTLPMPLLERIGEERLCISPAGCEETPYYHDGSLSGDVPLKALSTACGAVYSIVSQVNLHVFPFTGIHAHGEAGKPVSWRGAGGQWRGGFVLSGLELLLKEHLRFLLRLIALLNVSPTFRGINARALALQPYTGDITVSPRRMYWRHLKLMNDQSFADVLWYVQEGRLMAFPKLHIISNRMRIERAIEGLVAAAEAAGQLTKAAAGRSSRDRVSSRKKA
ncbi:hypothetical protein Efla_006245 [Eimeria flavescens]